MRQQHPMRADETRCWSRHERQYLLVRVAAVLMVPVVLASLLALLPKGYAVESHEVEGSHGVLQVSGALTESACRLEMASAWQTVDLGDIGTARLKQVGDRGAPVSVQLRLQDCLRSPASQRDSRSGNLLWASAQPSVSVSFVAPADLNTPELVAVQGAQGLGLRVRDAQGRDVRLGERGAPLFLTPGNSVLRYTVAAERTAAELQAGAYRATVDFRLHYD